MDFNLKRKINNITIPYKKALEKAVNTYFRNCDAVNFDKIIKPYTYSGLCYFLGLSRSDVKILEEHRLTSEVFANAKLKIENFIEENVLAGKISATSAMYSLKRIPGCIEEKFERETGDIIIDISREEERYMN